MDFPHLLNAQCLTASRRVQGSVGHSGQQAVCRGPMEIKRRAVLRVVLTGTLLSPQGRGPRVCALETVAGLLPPSLPPSWCLLYPRDDSGQKVCPAGLGPGARQ